MQLRFVLPLFLLWSVCQAAPDGEALYEQHCAACHGSEGLGGVGVPLALPAFQQSVDDDFLHKTIRLGRPGRVMPGFRFLKDQEIDAIVQHLRGFVPGKRAAFSRQPVKGNAAHGKALYAKYCAACHGAKGEGGKGTGVTFSRPRDLPIIAPAINNSGFLASAGDAMIKEALMQGREGTPMISFLKQGMTEQDINDVVAYVRSFEKQPPDEKPIEFEKEPLTLVYDSPHSFEQTVEKVKQAAVGMNFRIIRVQTLEDGLQAKGEENSKQVIVYFCNFQLLNQALAVDPRVGLFLPCRVTVVERAGKVQLYAINPKRLSVLFNNNELNKLCTGMYDTYVTILEEASL
ncbi:MAG: c-type cytochrome [Gammaproteobacteria bacterium]|nr:c-type cytochrome [Gammaproteobacteria bacterium]MDH5650344.1 c-type cytochrome [Gammaproteobacteria bacterium]